MPKAETKVILMINFYEYEFGCLIKVLIFHVIRDLNRIIWDCAKIYVQYKAMIALFNLLPQLSRRGNV